MVALRLGVTKVNAFFFLLGKLQLKKKFFFMQSFPLLTEIVSIFIFNLQ